MTELWPHQQACVDLIGPRGCGMAAMDVGTGKTLTALALLQEWGCRRVLIVCPLGVVPIWPREFRKHGLTEWTVIDLAEGSIAKRAQALRTADLCAQVDGTPFAAAVNYQAVCLGTMPETLASVEWDGLVLDESQNIKGWEGKAAQAIVALAQRIPHRLGLTGTVLHDTHLDAFGQFLAIDPTVFGTNFFRHRNRYGLTAKQQMEQRAGELGERELRKLHQVRPPLDKDERELLVMKYGKSAVAARENGSWPPADETARQAMIDAIGRQYVAWRLSKMPHYMKSKIVEARNLADFAARMAPCTYVCAKRDVLPDLPPVIHEQRLCLLTPETRKRLETERARMRQEGATGVGPSGGDIRLAQIVQGFSKDPETGREVTTSTEKRDLLIEVLQELPPAEPVVVFGWFHHDLATIRQVAEQCGRTSSEVSGRTKAARELATWQAGDTNLLAVQHQAGGEGIDLTRACVHVFFAHPWSLGDYTQILGRGDRPGQTRPVTYIHLVAARSIDERIMDALASKRSVTDEVDKWLREGQELAEGVPS